MEVSNECKRRNGLYRTIITHVGDSLAPEALFDHPTKGKLEVTDLSRKVMKGAAACLLRLELIRREAELGLPEAERQEAERARTRLMHLTIAALTGSKLDPVKEEAGQARHFIDRVEQAIERLADVLYLLSDDLATPSLFNKVAKAAGVPELLGDDWKPLLAK